MTRHIVASVREIPPGSRKRVVAGGRPIVIFNLSGAFMALHDRCPHQGAPLGEGHLTGLLESSDPGSYRYSRAGEILRCPWHGWEFDIRTGQSYCDPARTRTRAYDVQVVHGPYVAETVPVAVDDDYLVIDL